MLDLDRLRPILLVSTGILSGLAILNFLFLGLSGPYPVWLNETINHRAQSVIGTGAQIATITHYRRIERRPAPLNLVIGQSQAVWDIDCHFLKTECASPSKWRLVNSYGSSFMKMAYAVRPLFRSGLHPHLCLLVIDPVFLVGVPSVSVLPDHRRIVNREVDDDDDGSVWLWANRQYVQQYVQFVCEATRERMMGALNIPVDATYSPNTIVNDDRTPFIGTAKTDAFWLQVHAKTALLDKQVRAFEKFGYFNEDAYHSNNAQANALLEIIDGCRRIGAKVVVVIAPESPEMISRLPKVAEQSLERVIDRARSKGPLSVLNLRQMQPTANMYDYLHVNQEGKRSTTAEIIKRLRAEFGPAYGAN